MNPLSPGRPMAAMITTMNAQPSGGRPSAGRPAQRFCRCAGVPTPSPPEGTWHRNESVVDHLEYGPGDALAGEREDPEHDEADIRDGTVSHQAFQVFSGRRPR